MHYYVGCDLHKEKTWFYVIDISGKRVISKSISNSIDELHSFFKEIPKPFILAVEATYNWYFFIDIAEKHAEKVYLANSYELKAFAKRHKKTDKIDAHLIADVLRKGYLPIVTIPDKRTRMLRELLKYRLRIAQDRSRNIFRLKNLLDKLGEDSTGDFTTYKGLREIPTEHLLENYQDVIKGYIERIIYLAKQLYDSKKLIKEEALKDSDVRNLMTIPGVDSFSAMLIKTEIIDINRFCSFNRLCAYAGLAPKISQSANKLLHGPLNTNRRKDLQWILLEIVYHFIKAIPKYKRKHEKLARRKGYNTAKVILARDMLKIIYHILKEKRPFYNNSLKIDKIIRPEVACALTGV